ncbi:hypothetical protein TREES_T100020598 [Tupaia chinensis]|uniref:Uncharacterized protein n=1 Tax=Tupaia chinensis TaxID=246437 RepID=L9KQA4_TUPCH|nr:hypothetical protein TREES_T100020598 [Tupaia chinensis]
MLLSESRLCIPVLLPIPDHADVQSGCCVANTTEMRLATQQGLLGLVRPLRDQGFVFRLGPGLVAAHMLMSTDTSFSSCDIREYFVER